MKHSKKGTASANGNTELEIIDITFATERAPTLAILTWFLSFAQFLPHLEF